MYDAFVIYIALYSYRYRSSNIDAIVPGILRNVGLKLRNWVRTLVHSAATSMET